MNIIEMLNGMGGVNMKKATINDIAKLAGVSKATVSMVINSKDSNISEETRNKILDIAKELNYIPNFAARSLTTNRTNTIGIIVPDITNPFFSEISRAIEDKANSKGYSVILCNTDNILEKEEVYVKLLISKQIDGVIFISGGKTSGGVELLKANNIPFVLVDRYVEEYQDLYGVYCENTKGMIEAMEYLYNIGRRKIAFVTGRKDLEISIQRFNGYTIAAKKYGIFDEKLIFDGDFTAEGGKTATEEMLKKCTDIDAILYSNDIMAMGGIKALTKKGYRVPQDVAVVGFDDIQISQLMQIELTTVAQPIYDMGRAACSLLIDIINHKEIKKKIIYFTPKLVIRESA